jgi:hypothetical protein
VGSADGVRPPHVPSPRTTVRVSLITDWTADPDLREEAKTTPGLVLILFIIVLVVL